MKCTVRWAGKNAGMFVYAVEDRHNEEDKEKIAALADCYIGGFDYFIPYQEKLDLL